MLKVICMMPPRDHIFFDHWLSFGASMGDRTVPIARVDLQQSEASKAGVALHSQSLPPLGRDAYL
ncbi:hypothetical protein [Hydrogenophaga sp. 2FB]|uniref:hypothetical protein n=1 Tax=Hydrogenophaga sp. 2FB TaxID=2502187 RepID=UPI0010F9D417|nr:hypothetical protein [Hydrogenophaga sp. 2FB]